MDSAKRSLCVFIHFSNSSYIPFYVLLYLKELAVHFDEIILVTNKRLVENEKEIYPDTIKTLFVKNEGYDLGMFYKAFQTINSQAYRQIACINDSNILFNKLSTVFEWGKSVNLDFWGLIDSMHRPPFSTHENDYHLQSHFMVFNEKAIALLPAFFDSIHIESIFNESDIRKLREEAINQWEIGVSQFMLKNGLTIGSYFNGRIYTRLYLSGKLRNISIRLYHELIKAGCPLIKKKVILDRSFRNFIRFKPSWKKLMREYGNKDWEIKKLVHELIEMRNQDTDRPVNKLKMQLHQAHTLPANKDREKND